ncbi:ff73e091-a282-4604-93a7-a2f1a43ae6ed [Thermothielavioides terrestris]|uniref:Ff73e091-a282-4604-93a7-a2f1a43ae6ed n=1 Tax=Thermothielavioides terrestris TaxID=2587410 RepID=A0A446BH02_9PEZI|nr:ff73e091-a282-4604-93a7-a2f1a43ae6ed [Thermothielavioides terrestris]
MAALPENWEWDYDGTRWFYRYKPTGLIQYTFPKPGDEFPEFVDDNAAPLDLAPEERLVSQQQIKRRSTLGGSWRGQPARAKQRERAVSNVSSDQDDGSEPFWLQPDGLMYMGPGAYNDISPLQEEDEDERGQATNDADDGGDKKDSASAAAQHVADGPAAAGSPSKGAAVAVPSQISPSTSTETTPQVPNSHPATATPQIDRAIIVESVDAAPAPVVAAPVDPPAPEIPLLDSREVPYDPLGFVAELPSELTAQCHVEINPAPVELPGNELMVDTSEPAPYANAFHLEPAELPSDEIPAGRRVARNTAEQKSLSSQTTRSQQEQQQQRPHQTTRELLSRPYGAARQNSTPQVASTVAHMPGGGVAEPPPSGKYQPYNPARQGAFGAAAANRHSIAEIRPLVPADDNNKRHSLAGPALSRVPPSDVPAALLPPHIPPKLPLDSPDSSRQSSLPGAEARHESISGLTTKASGGLTHFPSVLQPARGRPVMRAQSPPQSKGASPARAYQAYKPYHDLQRDIEDTVQLLSNAGFGL